MESTRRYFFQRAGVSLGAAALGSLFNQRAAANDSGPTGLANFTPRAKRVIYLFQSGAPSQIDLFDPKPLLDRLFDKDLPDSVRQGQRLTTMTSGQARFPLAPSKYKFQQHGRSGAWVSVVPPLSCKALKRGSPENSALQLPSSIRLLVAMIGVPSQSAPVLSPMMVLYR